MGEKDVKYCESCGMPMEKPEDHGANDPKNPYCKHCTNPDGSLKSREEVRENMIEYYMVTKNKPRYEAENVVDAIMKRMPAWK